MSVCTNACIYSFGYSQIIIYTLKQFTLDLQIPVEVCLELFRSCRTSIICFWFCMFYWHFLPPQKFSATKKLKAKSKPFTRQTFWNSLEQLTCRKDFLPCYPPLNTFHLSRIFLPFSCHSQWRDSSILWYYLSCPSWPFIQWFTLSKIFIHIKINPNNKLIQLT